MRQTSINNFILLFNLFLVFKNKQNQTDFLK